MTRPSYVDEERAELLRRWVQSNENIAACESLVKATRRSNLQGQRVVQLVAVKDMSKPPFNFSEKLDNINSTALLFCYCSLHTSPLRRKIAHIIAHQQGVEAPKIISIV